jgi:hypothetical protein
LAAAGAQLAQEINRATPADREEERVAVAALLDQAVQEDKEVDLNKLELAVSFMEIPAAQILTNHRIQDQEAAAPAAPAGLEATDGLRPEAAVEQVG